MTQEREYEGPAFVAYDEAGNEYTLIPVYRCRNDENDRPVNEGYGSGDLVRIWSSYGDAVRWDGPGRYTILDRQPQREVALTSRHPKAV